MSNTDTVGAQAGQTQQIAIKEGSYLREGGQNMVVNMVQNRVQLRVGNQTCNCSLDLTQEQVQNRTKLMTKLSNGQNAEIKIMPDVAAERALERLRLKVCNENCTIELKEVGIGNQIKAAYEVKTQKQAKIFGLFKTKMQIQTQVNAENGEIIRVNRPWWSFLASESEE